MKSKAKVMEIVEQAIQPAEEAARTKVRHTLDAARASLHNGKERVRTTARHAAENADGYVHSNPWPAIGLAAAAAGAAIVVLLSTRIHR